MPKLEMSKILDAIASGRTLDETQSERAFGIVMEGRASDAAIAALLMGMRVRGETPAELTGAVRAIRARMVRIAAPPGTIDLCGTGGDGAATLNVSTATAFVVAACGVPVAKHGNRAISSRSGGADVLAALGIDHDPPVERQREVLATAGLAFLFAPRHHAALRHAAAARAALGIRTLLNLAGPLCNPASVPRQLTGVYDPRWLEPMAEALRALGTERAWLVHGAGLDELSISDETQICELRPDGTIAQWRITPEDAGLERSPVGAIAGGQPSENARALVSLLDGARGAYRDIVLLNAAACLLIAGRTANLSEGAVRAARAIDEGAAAAILARMRHLLPPSHT